MVSENSAVAVMELILSDASVVFVKTIGWLTLVVPTACAVKLRYVGEKLTIAVVPVPVTELVWPPPVPLSITITLEL